MKVEEIKKWINSSKLDESIIYYTGHMVEERDKVEIREMANAFMLTAQQGKIDLFQNKIKEGYQSHKPIYEYIARRLKNERNQDKSI